jgi:hypothetical protein
MEGLLVLFVIVIGLAAFGVAAMAFGVDSRDGAADPRSPTRPVGIS